MMEREAAFAEEHGLVSVIDIGKLGSPSSQISALRNLILHHPQMRFVVCHLLAPKQTELHAMQPGPRCCRGQGLGIDGNFGKKREGWTVPALLTEPNIKGSEIFSKKIEIPNLFYGSMTLKVFSNLDAYASRRFRTVGSPLICTCPAC